MNKLSSVLGAAAVLAIAVVFILQFRPATGAKLIDQGPQCVAEVRGHCIPTSHFWAAFRMMHASPQQAKAMSLRRMAVEGLVERFVLNEDAKRLGISVSEEEVSRALRAGRVHLSLPADKLRSSVAQSLGIQPNGTTYMDTRSAKKKGFDLKQYEKSVRQVAKMSPEEFREFQRQETVAARVRDAVQARVHVSEAEAFADYARDKSTATIEFVRFDARFFGDMVVERSAKGIAEFAEKNKEEIDKSWESAKKQFTPECRVARHFLVKSEEVDETKKAAAKKKAQDALDRVTKGEDFADVAREISDDVSSGLRGGQLGCVGKGMMVKPFEDAVFSLDKGKVSGIIETEYGYHVVKVDYIAKDAEAEKLGRDQITEQLFVAHEIERLAAESAKAVLGAIQGGKSLDDALKAQLEDLKTKVEARSSEKPKKDEKKKKTDDDKSDAKAGAKVTFDTHPNHPVVDTSMPFNAQGEPIQGVRQGTDVAHMAFALVKPGDVPNDIVPLEHGYAVFRLKDKQAATKESFETNRAFFVAKNRASKQGDALIGYVKRLKSTYGSEVKINQSLTEEPKDVKGGTPDPEDDGSGE